MKKIPVIISIYDYSNKDVDAPMIADVTKAFRLACDRQVILVHTEPGEDNKGKAYKAYYFMTFADVENHKQPYIINEDVRKVSDDMGVVMHLLRQKSPSEAINAPKSEYRTHFYSCGTLYLRCSDESAEEAERILKKAGLSTPRRLPVLSVKCS